MPSTDGMLVTAKKPQVKKHARSPCCCFIITQTIALTQAHYRSLRCVVLQHFQFHNARTKFRCKTYRFREPVVKACTHLGCYTQPSWLSCQIGSLVRLTPEDGIDMTSRNIGNQLPTPPRNARTSVGPKP